MGNTRTTPLERQKYHTFIFIVQIYISSNLSNIIFDQELCKFLFFYFIGKYSLFTMQHFQKSHQKQVKQLWNFCRWSTTFVPPHHGNTCERIRPIIPQGSINSKGTAQAWNGKRYREVVKTWKVEPNLGRSTSKVLIPNSRLSNLETQRERAFHLLYFCFFFSLIFVPVFPLPFVSWLCRSPW